MRELTFVESLYIEGGSSERVMTEMAVTVLLAVFLVGDYALQQLTFFGAGLFVSALVTSVAAILWVSS